MEIYLAPIHRICLSVLWLKCTRLHVMSPRISLKRATLHWTNRCFSTDRALTSTYDSAESIAASPPESDLDDEQIRNMLVFNDKFTGERSKCRPITRVSLFPRELSAKLISLTRSAGKRAAMFSHKRKSSQETLSDREGISSGRQPVQGKR